MSPPALVRGLLVAVGAVGVLLASGGCSADDAPPDGSAMSSTPAASGTGVTSGRPDGSAETGASTPASGAAAIRQAWGEFEEGELVVELADAVWTWCVLVADTDGERRRGLMDAPGPDLGGYEGMAFVWDDDVTGGFWMKDTEVPLSIAYVDADGGVVSTADMDPCPPGTDPCPSYPAGGPYRMAVEVPQGLLDERGLVGDAEPTVRLERRACADAPATSAG